MKRPSGPTLAAGVFSLLVGLLYLSPVVKDVRRRGLDWPIWIDHPEGLIHTNTGKWLVAAPHRPFVEGASGEFPQYYPSLSDTLLNLVGGPLGIPTMTVQAVLFGPLLACAFLLFNYLSLAAVLRDRWAALAASLVLSLGGNSTFLDRVDPASGLPLNVVLHVPFHVISLGTSQSLGWVLLLPALGLAYLAYREFDRRHALAAGALLGVLFLSHTLTFVNVAAVELAYLILANLLERPRDRRFKAWLLSLGVLTVAFVGLTATRPKVSFFALALLGLLALGATFLLDPNKRFYLWCYVPAGLTALPYAALLARHRQALAAMQAGWDDVQMMTVALPGFALFFAAYLLAALVGWRYARQRPLVVWLSAFVAATGFLAVNHLWHWGNHPYRYAIHLLFPLTILGVLGLREAPRWLGMVLGTWLGVVCVTNVWSFAAGRPVSVRFRVAEPERAAFFEKVRDVTRQEADRGVRLLPPVELTYPRGLVQSAMLMNYAQVPAFIPDYRHVLWPERYHNRMGLFCWLFPGYPNQDYPFGWRACDEDLDPDPALVSILEPRLKTGVLAVYRIAFAAAPGKPFSSHLKEASTLFGWPILAATDNAAFVRTQSALLPGLARLAPGPSTADTLAIRIEPERAGPHVVVLGGRRLDRRATVVRIDGRPLDNTRRVGNWAVCNTELGAGTHILELPSLERSVDPEADYLYFVAVASRDHAASYFAMPQETGPAHAER